MNMESPDQEIVQSLQKKEDWEVLFEKISYEGDWTDHPVNDISEDYFGFSEDVLKLARTISKTGTPIVFGIFGPWGVGKTSFMRMLRSRPEMRSNLLLWLNAWSLSNYENLEHAFIQNLITLLRKQLPWWRRWRFELEWFVQNINWFYLLWRVIFIVLLSVLTWAVLSFGTIKEIENGDAVEGILKLMRDIGVPVAGSLLAIWAILGPILRGLKGWINIDVKLLLKDQPFHEQISALEKLQRYLYKLVAYHCNSSSSQRIIVFIDDLDRCTPEKIPMVFEGIRHIAYTPKCVYVIGVDIERVKKGIAARYNFSDKDAIEYLEKIFQAQHYIPPLNKGAIQRFIQDKYPGIYKKSPSLPEVIAAGASPNPRRLKRLINKYRITINRLPIPESGSIQDLSFKVSVPFDIVSGRDPEISPKLSEEQMFWELLMKMVIIEDRYPALHAELNSKAELLMDYPLAKKQGLVTPVQFAEFESLLFSGGATFNSAQTIELFANLTATKWEA